MYWYSTALFAPAVASYIINLSPLAGSSAKAVVVLIFTPTYCFCTFFNVVSDVSYNNSKSSSAAVSVNSVWPDISKVFVKFVFVIFLKAEAESS